MVLGFFGCYGLMPAMALGLSKIMVRGGEGGREEKRIRGYEEGRGGKSS